MFEMLEQGYKKFAWFADRSETRWNKRGIGENERNLAMIPFEEASAMLLFLRYLPEYVYTHSRECVQIV